MHWIEITVYYYFGSDSSATRYILETFVSPGVQGISSSFPQPKKKKKKKHTHTREGKINSNTKANVA